MRNAPGLAPSRASRVWLVIAVLAAMAAFAWDAHLNYLLHCQGLLP
jgi:hypothetical protein